MQKLHLVSHAICPYVQRAVIALLEKNAAFGPIFRYFDVYDGCRLPAGTHAFHQKP